VAYEGWLRKRGRRKRSAWRKRYCVLYHGRTAGVLCYYTGEDRKRKKGVISLEDATVYAVSDEERPLGFNIITGPRVWEM
jgi:hypothetical protein